MQLSMEPLIYGLIFFGVLALVGRQRRQKGPRTRSPVAAADVVAALEQLAGQQGLRSRGGRTLRAAALEQPLAQVTSVAPRSELGHVAVMGHVGFDRGHPAAGPQPGPQVLEDGSLEGQIGSASQQPQRQPGLAPPVPA